MSARPGIDLAQIAHEERRAIRAKQQLPPIRDRDWFVLTVSILLLIIVATVLIPGLRWLVDGAPDNRPAAAERRTR